jgi:hypothetical protein
MATQQTEQAGSAQVAQVQAADSTVASGSIAGNDTAGATAGTVPAGAPVVAPKGFRLALQQMLQGWQGAVPGPRPGATDFAGSFRARPVALFCPRLTAIYGFAPEAIHC